MSSEIPPARVDRIARRAGAVYRRYAELDQADPELFALWTALANDDSARLGDEEGPDAAARAAGEPPAAADGQPVPLVDAARRLAVAERLGPHDHAERRLAAALAIELSRLDLAHRSNGNGQGPPPASRDAVHARTLANLAVKRSQDPGVRLAAALLLTRRSLPPRSVG